MELNCVAACFKTVLCPPYGGQYFKPWFLAYNSIFIAVFCLETVLYPLHGGQYLILNTALEPESY